MRTRVLLVLPTTTYRAAAFLDAARRLGVEAVVASERPGPIGGGQLVVDLADGAKAASPRDLEQLGPIHAVVGVDEASVMAASEIAEQLGVPGNPRSGAHLTRDKGALRRHLEGSGLPQPRFQLWRVGDPAPRVGFPCVVKPLDRAASQGVIRADSAADLDRAGAEVRARLAADPGCTADLLVESYVEGPEVAVEGLVVAGRLLPIAVYDKPEPLTGPYFEESIYLVPSRLPGADRDGLVEVLAEVVSHVGLRQGAVHAEFRMGGGAPVLIDLASRSIGGRCSSVLRFRSGSTLEELVIRAALGEEPSDLELDPTPSGVMMLPVPRSGRLRAVLGMDRALAVPGVTALELTAAPGTELIAPPHGGRYLGFLFARGETGEAVVESLRRAHSQLGVEIEGGA